MLKPPIEWLLARASEKTTWLGLLTAVPALAVHAPLIATMASLAASIGLVLVKERRPLRSAVVVQDVLATAEPTVDQIVSAAANSSVVNQANSSVVI